MSTRTTELKRDLTLHKAWAIGCDEDQKEENKKTKRKIQDLERDIKKLEEENKTLTTAIIELECDNKLIHSQLKKIDEQLGRIFV